jgi:hypothetical protein
VKRRVRAAGWLFARSRTARLVFVLVTWPAVWAADRVRGVDPPARFRAGLGWAWWG